MRYTESERPLLNSKARVKAKNLLQSQRREIPTLGPFSVYIWIFVVCFIQSAFAQDISNDATCFKLFTGSANTELAEMVADNRVHRAGVLPGDFLHQQ